MKINSNYIKLYTSTKKIILVTGGRGSAKSFEVARFLQRLTFERGHKILFTRYTLDSASISIIPEFQEKIEMEGTHQYFHVTKKEVLNLSTGSEIWFRGIKTQSGNQTAKLKSIQGLTTFVVDEAEEWPSIEEFKKLMRSIRQPNIQNRIIIVMNPSDATHWVYDEFIKDSFRHIDIEGHQIEISTHPEVEHIHTTYLGNVQHLSDDFLRDALHTSLNNPNEYRHQFLGGWKTKPEGVIFNNWEIGEFDESLPFVHGMDFGYVNDPTTLIKCAIDSKKRLLYVAERLYKVGLSTDEIFDNITGTVRSNDLIVADSAEPRLIDELIYKGFNIHKSKKGPDSVKLGLSKMASYKIIVSPESANIKTELNNYVWNEKRSNTPIDKYNHCIDAIRYAMEELTETTEFFFK